MTDILGYEDGKLNLLKGDVLNLEDFIRRTEPQSDVTIESDHVETAALLYSENETSDFAEAFGAESMMFTRAAFAQAFYDFFKHDAQFSRMNLPEYVLVVRK